MTRTGNAHPGHPDRSRPVGIGRNVSGIRDHPDDPDPPRPHDTDPGPTAPTASAILDAWRERWARESDDAACRAVDEAERAAMLDYYSVPASADAYRPGDPDPFGDGLRDSWRNHRHVARES